MKCNAPFNSYLGASAYTLICPSCGAVHSLSSGALKSTGPKMDLPNVEPAIPVGSVGVLNEIRYVVISYSNWKENGTTYKWDEYTLFNPIHGTAVLSQFNGHWIYLTEIPPLVTGKGMTAIYEGKAYMKFSRYKGKLISTKGEFLYDFDKQELPQVTEYIQPPYMISGELTASSYTWFKGEHQPSESIQAAFNLKAMPPKKGIGMVQPFVGKFTSSSLATIIFLAVSFWMILQFAFYFTSGEQEVLTQNIHIDDSLTNKEIYTRPFELKGGLSNLEISMKSDIDNNWVYAGTSLINEATGDVFSTDIEAEYYHGVEGGESWTEGASKVSKIISQVPDGKYYLILAPVKPENLRYVDITISVTRDVFVISNGLVALGLILAFPVFYFIRRNYFEQSRWSNSDFSQYEE